MLRRLRYMPLPCHTISYYAILFHTMPYYFVLCHTMSYYCILCHFLIMPYYSILCHTIPYYAILFHTMPYYSISLIKETNSVLDRLLHQIANFVTLVQIPVLPLVGIFSYSRNFLTSVAELHNGAGSGF